MGRAEEMAAALQKNLAETAETQAPTGEGSTDEPEQQERRRTSPARSGRSRMLPDGGGWAGAQPRQSITRKPLNVGMPEQLDIHRRLAQLTTDTGISAQDAVAEAIDAWLTEHGYDRPRGKR